jgi:hypothetical protein
MLGIQTKPIRKHEEASRNEENMLRNRKELSRNGESMLRNRNEPSGKY